MRKIPLNPPLQKGEAVGMLGLIEMLLSIFITTYYLCLYCLSCQEKFRRFIALKYWSVGELSKIPVFSGEY
jgi:hypothetical protein